MNEPPHHGGQSESRNPSASLHTSERLSLPLSHCLNHLRTVTHSAVNEFLIVVCVLLGVTPYATHERDSRRPADQGRRVQVGDGREGRVLPRRRGDRRRRLPGGSQPVRDSFPSFRFLIFVK